MMLEKLEGLADRFDELQALLASPICTAIPPAPHSCCASRKS